MTEAEQKAFDFAQETTKQLLTLATAIFALTLTFIKDIISDGQGKDAIEWLHRGWILYLASIAFGVVTLMMLAGNLEKPNDGDKPSIYAGNVMWAARLQVLCFGAALLLTAVFGTKAI